MGCTVEEQEEELGWETKTKDQKRKYWKRRRPSGKRAVRATGNALMREEVLGVLNSPCRKDLIISRVDSHVQNHPSHLLSLLW